MASSETFSSEEAQWYGWGEWGKSLISALWLANPNFLPIRDWGIDDPETKTKAAIVVNAIEPFNLDGNKILYQNNIDQILPIASLTKLMTALIVLENMQPEEIVTVSEKAIAAYGDQGSLAVDEKITAQNLLYALLMESSNDAAMALAEHYDKNLRSYLSTTSLHSKDVESQDTTLIDELSFVDLMNKKAEELGLNNTHFIDPSGYEMFNVSTAREIVQMVKYSFHQPLIWQILKTPTINLSSADRKINHYWVNTDELLNRLPNIIGGKTGYTEEAQGCLILVIEYPSEAEIKERLITVVLGAQERFLETEKLIEWVEKAYKW